MYPVLMFNDLFPSIQQPNFRHPGRPTVKKPNTKKCDNLVRQNCIYYTFNFNKKIALLYTRLFLLFVHSYQGPSLVERNSCPQGSKAQKSGCRHHPQVCGHDEKIEQNFLTYDSIKDNSFCFTVLSVDIISGSSKASSIATSHAAQRTSTSWTTFVTRS